MKVYEVIFNWSTEDENGLGTHIFSTYEKAKEHFESIIENESNADISWVGDGVFDENGELNEGYEMNCSPNHPENEEHDLWWCIWNLYNDKFYDEIYLRIKEIAEI